MPLMSPRPELMSTIRMKIPQPIENPVNAMRILLPFMAANTSPNSSLIRVTKMF